MYIMYVRVSLLRRVLITTTSVVLLTLILSGCITMALNVALLPPQGTHIML